MNAFKRGFSPLVIIALYKVAGHPSKYSLSTSTTYDLESIVAFLSELVLIEGPHTEHCLL